MPNVSFDLLLTKRLFRSCNLRTWTKMRSVVINRVSMLKLGVYTTIRVDHWLAGMTHTHKMCSEVVKGFNSVKYERPYVHRCTGSVTIGPGNGLTPSNYLKQCWLLVNWIARNKLHCTIFIQGNVFENVVYQIIVFHSILNLLISDKWYHLAGMEVTVGVNCSLQIML